MWRLFYQYFPRLSILCVYLYKKNTDLTMPPKLRKRRFSSKYNGIQFLGVSKDMTENDLPTVRACFRYRMYQEEQFMVKGEELSVRCEGHGQGDPPEGSLTVP